MNILFNFFHICSVRRKVVLGTKCRLKIQIYKFPKAILIVFETLINCKIYHNFLEFFHKDGGSLFFESCFYKKLNENQ